jgi:Glycolipid 2-alpha-mannosyltransferase
VYGFTKTSVGYRAMCRFFAGAFLRHPALSCFRYSWRIDTDSVYTCPILFDVFARMHERGWVYGWNVLYYEAPAIAGRTLWNATRHFCLSSHLGEQALHSAAPVLSWWGEYSRYGWVRCCWMDAEWARTWVKPVFYALLNQFMKLVTVDSREREFEREKVRQ